MWCKKLKYTKRITKKWDLNTKVQYQGLPDQRRHEHGFSGFNNLDIKKLHRCIPHDASTQSVAFYTKKQALRPFHAYYSFLHIKIKWVLIYLFHAISASKITKLRTSLLITLHFVKNGHLERLHQKFFSCTYPKPIQSLKNNYLFEILLTANSVKKVKVRY